MSEDSSHHHAFLIGAAALISVAAPAMTDAAEFELSSPPSAIVEVLPRLPQNPTLRWMQSYGPDQFDRVHEDTKKFRVFLTGPGVSREVMVSVPSQEFEEPGRPEANVAKARDGQKPQLSISYRSAANSPGIFITADLDDMHARISSLADSRVDLVGMGITSIEITPAAEPRPAVQVPTLAVPTFAPKTASPPVREPPNDAPFGVPNETLVAVAAILDILKVVADVLRERRHNRDSMVTGPASPLIRFRLEQDAVVSADSNGAMTIVIRREDLEKIDDTDKQLPLTLVRSVRERFSRWQMISQREASPDPLINAEVESKRDELQTQFCGDWTMLKRFIQKAGNRLTGFEIEMLDRLCQ